LDPADVPAGLEPALDLFERLKLEANRAAWLGLDRRELQLGCYSGNGETYARHLDVFRGKGESRRLTAIYYLNEGWRPEEGGQLRLFLPSGDRDIAPITDRLLVFMSAEVEHAVLPALAERWALTAWHSGACRLPGT
jgi:SM-20-related protein